jgi:hypothetical protein
VLRVENEFFAAGLIARLGSSPEHFMIAQSHGVFSIGENPHL